jgi:hypothetical protein
MRLVVCVMQTFGPRVTSTLHVVPTRWLKDDLLEVGSHDGWIEPSTLHVVQRKVLESWNGGGCVPCLGKMMKTNDCISLHRSLDRVDRVTCTIGKRECIRYVGVIPFVHSKLRSITPVATKVHVILQSFAMLTWMCDTIELV